jgi:hypothetical protein
VFKFRTALRTAAAIGAAALVLQSGSAYADNLIGDGDGVTPVVGNSVGFGSVCTGASTVTKNVLLAIQRNGAANNNTFAAGSTVTLSVVSAPAGLTVTVPNAPANQITTPSSWIGAAQNTMSAGTVTAAVQLSTGTARTYTGQNIVFRASGTAATGVATSRDTNVAVTGSVSSCDTTAPTLNLPTSITVPATGPNGAVVNYTASASDANPTSPLVTCSAASGSTFVLGTTTVNCSAKDAAGNEATGSFTVTVEDTTGPVIGAITDITASATSASGAVVNYTAPTAHDAITGDRDVDCTPASGSTFALGVTEVTCSASDGNGNTSTKKFNVTVEDDSAPVLALPASILAEATSSAGAAVNYTASASDNVDGSVAADCTPASGSTFALGTTPVNCSATDAAGNVASDSFDVTVQDTTAPSFGTAPNKVAEATSASGAAVTFSTPTATDLVDGAVVVSCDAASGATFTLGTTTVTCTAADSRGNSNTISFDVTVQDTTAPTLTVQDVKVAATGTNGAVVSFANKVSATDLVDGSVTPVCTPASGSLFAIGETLVECTATDSRGNTSGPATLKVVVQRSFTGFYQPVDTGRTLNAVKSGSTLPLKFNVLAGSTQLTSTDIFKGLAVKEITCGATLPLDDIEQLSVGTSNLRWDATAGQYIWNWKTPSGAAGKCYQVTIATTDGASINALFKLR